MERATVVNAITKTLDYFYPRSRWSFFRTNPNQVRAEQLYDTLSSTAKVLSAIVSTVQHLKNLYPQSQTEQLTEQERLEYEQKDPQDGTDVTVTIKGEIFTLLDYDEVQAVEVRATRPKS